MTRCWREEDDYMREDDRYENQPAEGPFKDDIFTTIARFFNRFRNYHEPKK
jgi:hypothetical protein